MNPMADKQPTRKQKLAFENLLENHGNVSQAMLKAGYKPNTAKTPKNLTETEGFKILAAQFLPDNLLLKVHLEGLGATRVISAVNTDKEATGATSDFIEVPDHAVRHKYLETGYKIKGHLKTEAPGLNFLQQINFNADRQKYA